jgi:hypothetical protein
MRNLVWIGALVSLTVFAPAAFAQSESGTKGGTYTAGAAGAPPPGFTADKLNPTNCGTPDDPKSCGPVAKAKKKAKKKQS